MGTVKLESKCLPLAKRMNFVASIEADSSDLSRKEFSQKLARILHRNHGYKKIVEINNALNAGIQPKEAYVKKLTSKELVLFKFAPTSSADVERSFSDYKYLFNEKRKSFTFENLNQHKILNKNCANS